MKQMSSLFNFEVIENIFSERAEEQTTSLAKMLYLNCLMGYFRGKEANYKNAMGFELFRSEIKGYKTWEKQFIELHRAKLITITDDMLMFHNHWGTFIDRKAFDEVKAPENEIENKMAMDFQQEILENTNLLNLVSMKHKWTRTQVVHSVELFITEQTALSTQYANCHDVFRHLIHWVSANATKMNFKNESVKSNSKIIGM